MEIRSVHSWWWIKKFLDLQLFPSFSWFPILDRLQAESALVKKQEFLKASLDNLEARIFDCYSQGVLTLFDRVTREFHDHSEQPLSVEVWAQQFDLYLPDGKTRMKQEEVPQVRALAGERLRNVEMMIISPQGVARFLLASGQGLVDSLPWAKIEGCCNDA